jgi:toxin ParE1/3/4
MLRLHRSKEAEEDLIAIWGYIAADNLAAADAMLHRIDEKCQLLTHFPEMGQERRDVGNGLRHFPLGSYHILYRITPTALEVVRVLHMAQLR